jgi:type I restriction enzyme S subunit
MIGGVSINIIKAMSIALPPLKEQQSIADYLDNKTAEIDMQVALLEKKRESYNKLKRSLISKVVTRGLNPSVELKDSCNEWIGEIPAHWEIRRLKDVASLYTGNSLNDTQKEYYATNSFSESLPYIGSKDVELGVGKINYGGDYRIPVGESKFCVAPNGSSLLCVEGGSAGKKVGYVEQDVCFVNKLCCIYSQQNKKFIYYYLFSLEFVNQFNARLQGMIGGVSINIIKAMSIALPPLKEQQTIADYLDNKTAEIDEQIELIDKKINTYKKLKQSLIDEVVTGKRKI